jgi:DNA-binding response OmpR family regulator
MHVIAVIDDEESLCEVITAALEGRDVMVRCATTASLGLEMLVSERFDLALIDIVLPDASGLVLAEVVVNENIPVVLMSGDPSSIAGVLDLGFHCLEKPFPLAELDREVRRVIADRRRYVQHTRECIFQLRANIEGLDAGSGTSRRLSEVSRGLLDRASSACP